MILQPVGQRIFQHFFRRLDEHQPDMLEHIEKQFEDVHAQFEKHLPQGNHRDQAPTKPKQGLPAGLDFICRSQIRVRGVMVVFQFRF